MDLCRTLAKHVCFKSASPDASSTGAINEGEFPENQTTHLLRHRTLLQRFAGSCCGLNLAHPVTKNLAGAVLAFGCEMRYMHGQGKNFLGDYGSSSAYDEGNEVIAIGISLWCASTLLSTLTCPRRESTVLHILKSMGFAVGGVIYAAWDFWFNKDANDSDDHTQNDQYEPADTEPLTQVLDESEKPNDYKLDQYSHV